MPYHLWLSSEGGGVGYFMTDKFYECLMIYLLKQRYKYGVKTKYFCTKWHAWCWRKRSKLLEIIHLIITLPVCCAKFLKIQNMYLHLSVWPPPSHVWLLLYSSASFSSFNTDSTERVNPTKKKKKEYQNKTTKQAAKKDSWEMSLKTTMLHRRGQRDNSSLLHITLLVTRLAFYHKHPKIWIQLSLA